ncbi:hypothetical protein D9M71_574320 [compost metagenome]
MQFKGMFTKDPAKAMSQKEIDLQSSRLKFVSAAGGVVVMMLSVALATVKLSKELKK